jgi:hypothetical protein
MNIMTTEEKIKWIINRLTEDKTNSIKNKNTSNDPYEKTFERGLQAGLQMSIDLLKTSLKLHDTSR